MYKHIRRRRKKETRTGEEVVGLALVHQDLEGEGPLGLHQQRGVVLLVVV